MSLEADESELRRKVAEGSSDPEDYRNLAGLLIAAGRVDEATGIRSKALDLPLSNIERARLLTEKADGIYEAHGDCSQARSLAQSAITLLADREESTEVLLIRGLAYSALAQCKRRSDSSGGREEAAMALGALEKAIAGGGLDSDARELSVALVQTAIMHGFLDHSEDAIAYSHRALDLELDNRTQLDCLVVLGSALRASGKMAGAERVFSQALQHADNYLLPRLHYELGLVQRELKQLRSARESFHRALDALHTHPWLSRDDNDEVIRDTNLQLAVTSYDCADYEDAASAYSKVISLTSEDDPHRREHLLWLGDCEVTLSRFSEARQHLTEVLNSPNANSEDKQRAKLGLRDAHIGLAATALKDSVPEVAVREYEAALSFCTDDDLFPSWRPYLMVLLGDLYLKLGHHDLAKSYYEQVVSSASATKEQREAAAARLRGLPKTRVQ